METEKLREIEKIIRGMIEHENSLMNNRIGWMLAFNGFLFTAISISISQKASGNSLIFINVIISVVGIVTAVSTFIALKISMKAIHRLKTKWLLETPKPPGFQEIGVMGYEVPQKYKWILILVPWFIFPILMASVWLIILICQIFR